jgi:hypothetical protein
MQPNCPYCDVDGSRAKTRDELIKKINNEHNKDQLTKYLDKNSKKAKLFSTGMELLRPDIGYYLEIDGVEIAKTAFPKEYEQIREALFNVIKKLETYYDEENKRSINRGI